MKHSSTPISRFQKQPAAKNIYIYIVNLNKIKFIFVFMGRPAVHKLIKIKNKVELQN